MFSVWYTQPVACQLMAAGGNRSNFILNSIKKMSIQQVASGKVTRSHKTLQLACITAAAAAEEESVGFCKGLGSLI